jgi:hypothetical protein
MKRIGESLTRARLLLALGIGVCCWLLPLGVWAAPAQQVDPPPNDNFADAVEIGALPFEALIESIEGATTEENEPGACYPDIGNYQTVWYKFTPQSDVSARLRITSSSDVVWTIFAGTSLPDLQKQDCSFVYQSLPPFFSVFFGAGRTYYIRVGSLYGFGGSLHLVLEPPPPPIAAFGYFPEQPSTWDIVNFSNYSYDPMGLPFRPSVWDFGDGATGEGSNAAHQYASEGSYTVTMTATTFDGRRAAAVQVVTVENHDVAITKLSAPNAALAGQNRTVGVQVSSRPHDEMVRVALYKSDPTRNEGFVQVGEVERAVAAGGRGVTFDFNYTFTAADAQVGKVTFKVVATPIDPLTGAARRDIAPANNTAIALPTKVSAGQTAGTDEDDGTGQALRVYLPVVAVEY